MSALGRLLFGRQNTEERLFEASALIPAAGSGFYNASGYAVNTESALRHGAFYSCVNLIANSLSTTPLDSYRKRGDRRVAVEPSPSLLTDPSGDTLQVEWMFSLITSLLVRGNAFGFKYDLDPLGYPRQVELVHPDEATVRWATTPQGRTKEYRFNGEVVPNERVFHVKGFTMPGWLEGLSVVAHHAQTLGMGLAAGSYGAQFYDGAGHPSAVLETAQVLNKTQAEEVKNRVLSKLRSGRREPIVLGSGMQWKPIQIPPSESMFLDAQGYSGADIAGIFNVPVEKIPSARTVGNSITYANREANVIEFQTDALLPWAVRIEQALNKLIPRGQFVKFNMDAAIRVDAKTRYEIHNIALAGKPWKRPNEVRSLEDMEPDDELDEINPPPPVEAPPEEESPDAEAD